MLPPPPSLIANSASMRSRWFFTSQSTPLKLPPSSSAVSARVGDTGGLQPRCERLRRLRHVADRISGVDFDQLLENLAGAPVVDARLRPDGGDRNEEGHDCGVPASHHASIIGGTYHPPS